jgi:hypothetical protein
VGNKGRFALEYEIREFYVNDFTGDGKLLDPRNFFFVP